MDLKESKLIGIISCAVLSNVRWALFLNNPESQGHWNFKKEGY